MAQDLPQPHDDARDSGAEPPQPNRSIHDQVDESSSTPHAQDAIAERHEVVAGAQENSSKLPRPRFTLLAI